MTNKKEEELVHEEIKYQSIAEFLENIPQNQIINIADLSDWKVPGEYRSYKNVMRTPEIQLHCSHENCNGIRFFRCVKGRGELLRETWDYFYVTYKCSNCQTIEKTFSLAVKVDKDQRPRGECYKFGELPAYGPPYHLN